MAPESMPLDGRGEKCRQRLTGHPRVEVKGSDVITISRALRASGHSIGRVHFATIAKIKVTIQIRSFATTHVAVGTTTRRLPVLWMFTHGSAQATIVDVGIEIHLATVGRIAVAIRPSANARRHHALATRTAKGGRLRQVTGAAPGPSAAKILIGEGNASPFTKLFSLRTPSAERIWIRHEHATTEGQHRP